MKTRDNALSVWEVQSENESEEAVLAIVSGGDHLETIYIVPLISEYLRGEEIDIESEPQSGRTAVEDLRRTHHHLSKLSYRKLGVIAYHIVDMIKDGRMKRYTEGCLKEMLTNAICAHRLKVDDLKECVRKKIEKYLLTRG